MAKANMNLTLAVSDKGANEFGGPFWGASLSKALSLTDGTGANQFDTVFVDERTVADGADDDLDLAGVLSDALGVSVAMAELVGIVLINEPVDPTDPRNTTALTLGGGSNPVVGFLGDGSDTIGPIQPGGVFMIMAGDAAGIGAVTAGTGDILRVTNAAGAANTYQIALLGRSA